MNISGIKSAVICGIAQTGLQRRFHLGGATTLVFHRFFGEGETRVDGRERLKRICHWLKKNSFPLSAAEYLECSKQQSFLKNSLLVTIDDARKRILDAIDIFFDFEIPLTLFAVVGWTDGAQADSPVTLPRLITVLEHYRGAPFEILLSNGERLSVGARDGERGTGIDRVIQMANQKHDFVEDLWNQLGNAARSEGMEPEICGWKDLADLASKGVTIGSHSVSHCRLARQSSQRIEFEVRESRRIFESRFGKCDMFAYPYGIWDVHNDMTTAALKAAGYQCAFLVAAGFGKEADPYRLPRIAIPDQQIDLRLFAALAQGGQIPLIRLKNLLTGRNRPPNPRRGPASRPEIRRR